MHTNAPCYYCLTYKAHTQPVKIAHKLCLHHGDFMIRNHLFSFRTVYVQLNPVYACNTAVILDKFHISTIHSRGLGKYFAPLHRLRFSVQCSFSTAGGLISWKVTRRWVANSSLWLAPPRLIFKCTGWCSPWRPYSTRPGRENRQTSNTLGNCLPWFSVRGCASSYDSLAWLLPVSWKLLHKLHNTVHGHKHWTNISPQPTQQFTNRR